MKSITESIYERGKHGTKYLRVRIPKAVRAAYPQRCTHITLSLGTADLKEAKVLARSHRARLDVEFERVRQCLVDRQSALYTRQSIESKATVGRLEGDSFSNVQAMTNQASAPTKYLQRVLGHTSGDGTVTDGYGSDVPFEILVDYFKGVRFPVVPAKPWEQGRGKVRLIRAGEDA